MHVLTPTIMDILGDMLASGDRVVFSNALAELARREQYLAMEAPDRRYDIGARYGLLTAQMALALNGRDRDRCSPIFSNFSQSASWQLRRPASDEPADGDHHCQRFRKAQSVAGRVLRRRLAWTCCWPSATTSIASGETAAIFMSGCGRCSFFTPFNVPHSAGSGREDPRADSFRRLREHFEAPI